MNESKRPTKRYRKRALLNTAVELLHSLKTFIVDLSDRFDEVEEKGMKNCSRKTYEEETRRVRKMARHFDEIDDAPAVDIQRDNFRVNSYLPVIDCLITSIKHRLDAYQLHMSSCENQPIILENAIPMIWKTAYHLNLYNLQQ